MTARSASRQPPARLTRERGVRYSPRTGPVVVDASIAFLWFANEPDPWGAAQLLAVEAVLLAPDLMAVETTNAWWKKLRRHEMAAIDVEEAVTHLIAVGITWTPSASLLRPAARLAAELGHPVYDCMYLTLAMSHSAVLATADERLRRGAERVGLRIWRRQASG